MEGLYKQYKSCWLMFTDFILYKCNRYLSAHILFYFEIVLHIFSLWYILLPILIEVLYHVRFSLKPNSMQWDNTTVEENINVFLLNTFTFEAFVSSLIFYIVFFILAIIIKKFIIAKITFFRAGDYSLKVKA